VSKLTTGFGLLQQAGVLVDGYLRAGRTRLHLLIDTSEIRWIAAERLPESKPTCRSWKRRRRRRKRTEWTNGRRKGEGPARRRRDLPQGHGAAGRRAAVFVAAERQELAVIVTLPRTRGYGNSAVSLGLSVRCSVPSLVCRPPSGAGRNGRSPRRARKRV
jgi:hypothetical protein